MLQLSIFESTRRFRYVLLTQQERGMRMNTITIKKLWDQFRDQSVETLSTPTDALKDMEAAIKNGYDELTRIGIKMLSLEPNNSDQSGVALGIRNAAQNAAISTLNAKVSEAMKKVIKCLLNWI